ncbi:glycosyltransferase family 2 protein [Actinokineospora enzanensis]|uniref:glycosyltransferase family 2 protein n=1 Tax=Actinokineospora enzanensis TaxID=155975 RepID=UPI00037B45C4|nr:glycosyltransferase [Actinokineospora enzanensis]
MAANGPAPTLSVVIPVFNEQDWIARSVAALMESLAAADWTAQVVVVDDGSTDGTPAELARLAGQYPGLTVVSQANAGRFEARKAGVAKATGEHVALLDSRVIVEPGAFTFLREQYARHPERRVWNGHIETMTEGNPYAGFMAGLVKVGWRRYFAAPKLSSFGPDEFDLYPKGTTFFVAPREIFEGAFAGFDSLFDNVKLASDDTRVLRWIVERERIHIAPEFAALYNGRDSLEKFIKHSYFRGTTYVDSYLGSAGPARTALFGAMGVGLVTLFALVKRPKTTVVAGLLGSAAAGVYARRCGATPGEARSVGKLLPLFASVFGVGVIRGLLLALRARLRK